MSAADKKMSATGVFVTPAAGCPASVGDLRTAGYRYRSVKAELRENALRKLGECGEGGISELFPGVIGYEDTVVPQMLHAILSGHDTLLLGLRGQAKTRMLRAMVALLDEWIPVIDPACLTRFGGSDLPDDPISPLTSAGRRAAAELGDDLPLAWLHRSDRYHEKLATPDVTIADLIGEIDLIRHAEGRYLSDEATMHFGLVPRSNRGLFVMNELPDLAPRIQVGLFNVLEERDVQIRGYPVRLELDLALMFSANPEDYTNRGRIVTPLKDRIGSVVRTHYPNDLEEAMRITRENAYVERKGGEPRSSNRRAASRPELTPDALRFEPVPEAPAVGVPRVMHEILETCIGMARTSSHINQASGVSVRASIAALETMISAAEMRALRSGDTRTLVRPSDTAHIQAAFRGKIELMLAEDSSDGASTEDRLIDALFGEALKQVIGRHVDVEDLAEIAANFSGGLRLEFSDTNTASETLASLQCVDGLREAADRLARSVGLDPTDDHAAVCAGELVLEFLYVNNRLSKMSTRDGSAYKR
ncbi:MAG: magnesium chelatase [Phycisphaerales bacterium JB050]